MAKRVFATTMFIFIIAIGSALAMLNYEFKDQAPAHENSRLSPKAPAATFSDETLFMIVAGIFILCVSALIVKTQTP